MRKKLIFILFFFLLFLIGCSDKIVSITPTVNNVEVVIDIFDITDYTLTVEYKSSSLEVPITYDMLKEDELEYLATLGENSITITYEGMETVFNFTLVEKEVIGISVAPKYLSVKKQDFSFDLITITLLYNDNTTEEIALTKKHLSNTELIKINQTGTHSITVNYEGFEDTFDINLKPSELDIEELKQACIVYCYTEKMDDKYISRFYVAGKGKYSSLQFKMDTTTAKNIKIEVPKNDLSTIIQNQDSSVTVCIVSDVNLNEDTLLFTITFTSEQQYNNFYLNYDFDNKVCAINNNEVQIETDVLFTFSR